MTGQFPAMNALKRVFHRSGYALGGCFWDGDGRSQICAGTQKIHAIHAANDLDFNLKDTALVTKN